MKQLGLQAPTPVEMPPGCPSTGSAKLDMIVRDYLLQNGLLPSPAPTVPFHRLVHTIEYVGPANLIAQIEEVLSSSIVRANSLVEKTEIGRVRTVLTLEETIVAQATSKLIHAGEPLQQGQSGMVGAAGMSKQQQAMQSIQSAGALSVNQYKSQLAQAVADTRAQFQTANPPKPIL